MVLIRVQIRVNPLSGWPGQERPASPYVLLEQDRSVLPVPSRGVLAAVCPKAPGNRRPQPPVTASGKRWSREWSQLARSSMDDQRRLRT